LLGNEAMVVGDVVLPEITPWPTCVEQYDEVAEVLGSLYPEAGAVFGLKRYIQSLKELLQIAERYPNILVLPAHRLYYQEHWNIIQLKEVKKHCYVATARRFGVRVILSYHNFETTPGEVFILKMLLKAQDLGADIAKVAVMPKEYQDVLTLLNATLKARQQGLKIPAITMSMGPQGRLSRIAGGLFGSDITFACGNSPSAPGQIPIEELRQAMAALYS